MRIPLSSMGVKPSRACLGLAPSLVLCWGEQGGVHHGSECAEPGGFMPFPTGPSAQAASTAWCVLGAGAMGCATRHGLCHAAWRG